MDTSFTTSGPCCPHEHDEENISSRLRLECKSNLDPDLTRFSPGLVRIFVGLSISAPTSLNG